MIRAALTTLLLATLVGCAGRHDEAPGKEAAAKPTPTPAPVAVTANVVEKKRVARAN